MRKSFYNPVWLKFLAIVFGIVLSMQSHSQIVRPVKWSWKAEKIKAGEYNLVLTAMIDKNWHLFAQVQAPKGPLPTTFEFEKNPNITLVGKVTEKGDVVKEGTDPDFKTHVKYFEGKAVFTQRIKVLKSTKVKGMLSFMACSTVCTAPEDIDFEFNVIP
jgi:thiol:disulfide interchange protein DsbD